MRQIDGLGFERRAVLNRAGDVWRELGPKALALVILQDLSLVFGDLAGDLQ